MVCKRVCLYVCGVGVTRWTSHHTPLKPNNKKNWNFIPITTDHTLTLTLTLLMPISVRRSGPTLLILEERAVRQQMWIRRSQGVHLLFI